MPSTPHDQNSGAPPSAARTTWLIVKTVQARLRFVLILAAIGAVIGNWQWLNRTWEVWTRHAVPPPASRFEYFCPMHPAVITDDPKAKCPICHMDLSKRDKSQDSAALPAGIASRVQLSPYRMSLAGVHTSEVAYQPLTRTIETVGFVEFDETRLARIATRVSGRSRIDKLFVDVTGQMVHKGDPLALLYNPDLIVTVQNLRDAHRSGNADLERVARARLQLWGVEPDQIATILRTSEPFTHLTIRAPGLGSNAPGAMLHVIRKYRVEGEYVEEGDPLFDVADLSRVWIEAQVYENDLAVLEEGLAVTAVTPAYPNRPFRGRLAFVHPHLDRSSRTLTVRFNMENPGHELRPGMYATVRLEVPAGKVKLFADNLRANWRDRTAVDLMLQSLFTFGGTRQLSGLEAGLRVAFGQAMLAQNQVPTVPESAVIDTGKLQIVYRETDQPWEYEGVAVQLGPRSGQAYPVLRGLQAGDRIVSAGAFLIDAETRLNPSAGSIYFGGSGRNERSAVTAASLSTESKEQTIDASRKKIRNPGDRLLVDAQDYCPIQEHTRLGEMGRPVKVMLEGQAVFLCCKVCLKEARENPEETLKTVARLKAKTKPHARQP